MALADLVQDRVAKLGKKRPITFKELTESKAPQAPARDRFLRVSKRDAMSANGEVKRGQLKRISKQFVFAGENWVKCPDKPIAVFVGFNFWKFDHTPEFYSEYRVLFVKRKFLDARVLFALLRFPVKPSAFVVWSYTESVWVRMAAKLLGVPILRMEDGFLRSFGAGKLHTTPYSLVLDTGGLYFNPKTQSSLEHLLNTTVLDDDLEQARAGIALMKAGNLTKYYEPATFPHPKLKRTPGLNAILVVGQVEDDQSVRFGFNGKMSNNDMVRRVRKQHPDAEIFYRPHPDVVFTNRKSSDPRFIEKICNVLPSNIPLSEVMNNVDHVYTMTSLVGMEALVIGKKVTTFGSPFYSGWGLTEDFQKTPNRTRSLTIEELFAGAYLKYPRYFHPLNRDRIEFLELASFFYVEKALSDDLFNNKARVREIEAIKEHLPGYSTPLRLLAQIIESKQHGSLKADQVMATIGENFLLRDFQQVANLLIQSGNYDALAAYAGLCIEEIGRTKWTDTRLIENILYHLAVAQQNAHGRTFGELPDLMGVLVKLEALSNEKKYVVILNYLRCLSRNIQYETLEKALNVICARRDLPPDFLRRVVNLVRERPARSERNSAVRNRLLGRIGKSYRDALMREHSGFDDQLLNSVMFHVAVDDELGAVEAYAYFDKMFSDGFKLSNCLTDEAGDLLLRTAHFEQIFIFFLKKGRYELAEKILKSLEVEGNERMTGALWLEFYMVTRRYDMFLRIYDAMSHADKKRQSNITRYAKVLRCMGEHDAAQDALIKFSRRRISPAKKSGVLKQAQQLEFIAESGRILASVPQPRMPKGVVFLASQTCFNSLAMLIPALVEIKKQGYAVINLTEGMLPSDRTGLDYIDRFEGRIPLNLFTHEYDLTWEINWPEKSVRVGKFEFYQGFYERLSTQHRTFFVNLNDIAVYKDFITQLKRCDTVLSVCKQAAEELADKRGIPVSFVTGNSHVTPFSVVRDFCRQKKSPLISFINTNIAYENYFSNLGGKYANTFCVTDMTLHENIRAPFLARRDQFEPWYEDNKNNGTFLQQAEDLINVNRNSSTDNRSEVELIEYLTEQKKAGKKILCAFGKIPVDLNVPYDGGPAHEDMADWLNHTVETCGRSEDVILLIKPHPHELRPEIALDLQEGFADLIREPLADNVRILGHREINAHVLAPHLDLALLWNGSAGLELTAKGIPVMMCSHFGRHDYPVDLIYPADRPGYEAYLKAAVFEQPDYELRKKAAFLISFMNTDEITLTNQYSLRQVTNDKIGIPQWRHDSIARFLREGDPHIKRAADRILEKFEGGGRH
ncbi:hypothetical protein [Roseibium sp.]|uniref:capsular polysaccharide export protein, LipB/KpsS family n=1 Tax=Roseibium sp. TaxID=1936156 RepID=UPI003263CA9D